MITETPFFFSNGGYSLFGVLHQPQAGASKPAFVFCHALGEEKLWTQRVFVSFARRLAAEGHPVLRFDYRGNGDSDGEFSELSIEAAKTDVRAAIEEVRKATGAATVHLLGLRLGATIAALVAEEVDGIGSLILWAPVVDGGRYMQELLRVNLTTQMATHKEIRLDREALVAAMERGETVNVDGYEMAYPLYAEASAIKLAAAPKTFAGGCLIVQIDRQPGRPVAELNQLAASYPQASVVFAQEEPFWKEIARFYEQAPNLFAVTDQWLRPQTAGTGTPV